MNGGIPCRQILLNLDEINLIQDDGWNDTYTYNWMTIIVQC